MADNQSYKITPEIIVKDNLRFRIPLYQRLFAWKTPEVLQLLDDLRNHFERHPEDAYYLGMITMVKQGDRFDLIDGQQRTTVLTLLSIAFINVLDDGETKNLWSAFFDSANRLFFNGRSQDRQYMKSLVGTNETGAQYKNVDMEDGLASIYKYLSNSHNFSKGLDKFAQQVYEHLTIFVTELPSHYIENPTSLNEYFEAMNSSGKSLEQHEILKVELLKDYCGSDKMTLTKLWNVVSDFERPIIKLIDGQVDRNEQVRRYLDLISRCRKGGFKEVVTEICADYKDDEKARTIAEIEVRKHDFSDKVPRDKEDGIISFPQFLLFVLALHIDKAEIARIHPSKLYDTFKTPEYQLPVEKIGDFYADLLFYRILMDMYVVRLKYGASSSSHRLISRDMDAQDRIEYAHVRLRQFQAMLDVSTEPHIWLIPFLKYLKSCSNEPTQFELLKILMLNDLHRKGHNACPEPESLTYESTPKPRYWLWRTDYAIWEKLIIEHKEAFSELGYDKIDVDAIRHYEFRANRSIEHLHPQTENDDERSKWSHADIHSFGNLAMISQSFNSQQGNLPVHVKFANLEVQIGNKSLQSLKLYLMYLKAKGSDAEWTVTAKDEHAEEILKILEQSIEKVKSYEPR